MKYRFGFRVSGLGFTRRLVPIFLCAFLVGPCLTANSSSAAEMKDRAETEGKLMFYAAFNAADSKALTDGFKQLYPKIDATFYRTTDAALMERILTESRAGQSLWDVVMTTNFYGHNLKKRGSFALYDSPERKFFAQGTRTRRLHGLRSTRTMPLSVTTPAQSPSRGCRSLT